MDTTHLPFGRTSVSSNELRRLIDVHAAADLAREGGVANAEKRIQELIEHLPALLEWLEEHGRRYPWRKTTDPWKIYVTEVLLQRTRADAVDNIYDDFFDRFPGPTELANDDESDIRNMVHSLGFVNHRTRTLREVADLCVSHGGVPDPLDTLKEPWRVGDYSARACQLFARGQPLALVDANFARVIGRVLGYDMPSQPHKSDDVYALLDGLVPAEPAVARAFNLAILDLGALVCTPENPNCESCPINEACTYYQTKREES